MPVPTSRRPQVSAFVVDVALAVVVSVVVVVAIKVATEPGQQPPVRPPDLLAYGLGVLSAAEAGKLRWSLAVGAAFVAAGIIVRGFRAQLPLLPLLTSFARRRR